MKWLLVVVVVVVVVVVDVVVSVLPMCAGEIIVRYSRKQPIKVLIGVAAAADLAQA